MRFARGASHTGITADKLEPCGRCANQAAINRRARPTGAVGSPDARVGSMRLLRPAAPPAPHREYRARRGVILTAINQSGVIASGHATTATWVRCGLNFVVPFLVSDAGLLSARR